MNQDSVYSIRLTTFFSILLIILLGLFAYSSSINGKFIWDDNNLVVHNDDIKTFKTIPSVLQSNIAGSLGNIYKSYRPLQIISYMLDYKIWGYNAFGYHLSNSLLHILVALTLYWLIRAFFDDWVISFLCAAIYVVLPIHTEAVSYISGRADSLAALFMLLSFIFYIKYERKANVALFVISMISYTLALLSRENVIIFPILLLIYSFIFVKPIKKGLFFGISLLSIVYIILRLTIFKFEILSTDFYSFTTIWQRLPGVFVAITSYIKLLLIPVNLHMEYGKKLFLYINPLFWLGLIVSILLLYYVWANRRKNKIVSFSILWFYVCLIPHLNLYPINAYMAEHWLYLPSMGFAIVVAYYLSYWWRQDAFRAIAFAVTLLLIGTYSLLTLKQNEYWTTATVFCKRTLKYSPDNYKIYSLLANAYVREQKYNKAITACQKSIKLNPSYSYSYFNLGLVYMDLKEYDNAVKYFEISITKNLEFINAYNNMAVCYFEKGNIDKAIEISKKIIQMNSRYTRAYYNLVMLYSIKGEISEADKYEKKLEKLGHTIAEEAFKINAE